MALSRQLWQQLKNLTADNLISALERDGWLADKPSGAIHPFLHPVTRKRVTIHYHPKKTYGEKLLRALLDDIEWSEEDFVRLGLAGGKVATKTAASDTGLDVGAQNGNGQIIQAQLDHDAWLVLCTHCGNKYGSLGGEFNEHACPKCQGGQLGLQIELEGI